jgi:hypothetical protein
MKTSRKIKAEGWNANRVILFDPQAQFARMKAVTDEKVNPRFSRMIRQN